MLKRMTVCICLLLKENPQLPLQFNFNGRCLIEQLKHERAKIARKLGQESPEEKEAILAELQGQLRPKPEKRRKHSGPPVQAIHKYRDD